MLNKYNLSLKRQEVLFHNSLILNPVENIPALDTLYPSSSFLHGLYITDKVKNNKEKKESKILFGGRSRLTSDIINIYKSYSDILKAKGFSARLLSGLHAHIIIFMGIGKIGETVLLLPESAGGHMATHSILSRLGYTIIDMVINHKKMSIDIDKTKKLIKTKKPNYIFVDRSEGLNYEDFTKLIKNTNIYSIFDASQYLSHIISKDYKHPFDMGFDLVISTVHKNFPGTQKAIVFTKRSDKYWYKIQNSMGHYVSNIHASSIYPLGLILDDIGDIALYSKNMLANKRKLEQELIQKNLPIVKTNPKVIETQHIWIKCDSKDEAFMFFRNLEKCRINTNYRLLPYEIGYGLRIGLAAATLMGLKEKYIHELATYIHNIWINGFSLKVKHDIRHLIRKIKNEH